MHTSTFFSPALLIFSSWIAATTNSNSIIVVAGERVYETKITIGPEMANSLNDLLLDDFTGNGRLDLITGTKISPTLNFAENQGQGLFGAPRAVDSSLSWSATAYGVASGDLDEDGYNDLVVLLSSSESSVRIYWDDPQNPGEFSDFTDLSLDAIVPSASGVDMDIQVADMNGDGFLDIILTLHEIFKKSDTMLLLLENDGSGSFTDNIRVVSDDIQGSSKIAVGDYNADGLPDIAVNARYRNMVFIFTNTGDGTFERKIVDISTTSNIAIGSGDVNGDGYDDLLCQGEDSTTLYVNNQDGTFEKYFQYEINGKFKPSKRRVQIVDVDGDGLMDLVSMPGEILWQKQTSSDPLTFSEPLYINADTAPKPIPGSALAPEKFLTNGFAFGDVNGDGIVDFIAFRNSPPQSVYAFLGENAPSTTPLPTNLPTKTPTKRPISMAPTPLPTNAPTNSPTKRPISMAPTPLPTNAPTNSPTKRPITMAPTPPPTRSPTKQPVSVPTEKPVAVPSPTDTPVEEIRFVPTISTAPSDTPTKSIEPTTASPTTPLQETIIRLSVVHSTETAFDLSRSNYVEEVFRNSVESVLRNSSQLESISNSQSFTSVNSIVTTEDVQGDNNRELLPIVESDEGELSEGCFVAKQGKTDEQCRIESDKTVSYKCIQNYLCCTQDHGEAIDAQCSRNAPLFDVEVHAINVTVRTPEQWEWALASLTGIPPDDYCENVEIGNACFGLDIFLTGPNSDDLAILRQIVVNSTENGNFDSALSSYGFDVVTIKIYETDSPTLAPSLAPTITSDLCPLLSDNCTSCVSNTECLWCQQSGVCFNADPEKRMRATSKGVSRFLEPSTGDCNGIPLDGSTSTCPANPPTSNIAMADSSGTSALKDWSFPASALVAAILLYLT